MQRSFRVLMAACLAAAVMVLGAVAATSAQAVPVKAATPSADAMLPVPGNAAPSGMSPQVAGCPAGAFCGYMCINWACDAGPVYNDNTNLLVYPKFRYAESVYNQGNNCNVAMWSGVNFTGTRSANIPRYYGYTNLNGSPWYHSVASNDWCV